MSRVFTIGDLHFGHRNILKFTTRKTYVSTIEEHDALIVSNWNEVVRKKEDLVYVLGDVAWTRESAEIHLPQLNGRKILIAGNHDPYGLVKPYFDKIFGAYEKRGCIFTHIPVHPSQLYNPTRRWEFNIHGHLHDDHIKFSDGRPDLNYINVSAEKVEMTPIPLDLVIQERRELRDYD